MLVLEDLSRQDRFRPPFLASKMEVAIDSRCFERIRRILVERLLCAKRRGAQRRAFVVGKRC